MTEKVDVSKLARLDPIEAPGLYRRAIPALLRLARAAKARHETWTRETYVEVDEALAAFDFTETPASVAEARKS